MTARRSRRSDTPHTPPAPGSASEQAASAWAADYLRALGFQNVRVEDFPLVGWERGEESGAILGDRPQPLVLAALGHSPATPEGGIEAWEAAPPDATPQAVRLDLTLEGLGPVSQMFLAPGGQP